MSRACDFTFEARIIGLQGLLEEMPDDPVRLQLLLHHRDKQLDDLSERFKVGG